MINAIIGNKNEEIMVTEFSCNLYDLYSKLYSIGIMKSPNNIKPIDKEDQTISVKRYADSDIGNP